MVANGTKYKNTSATQIAFSNAMDGLTTAIQQQMSCMFTTAMSWNAVSTIGLFFLNTCVEKYAYWPL